MDSDAATELLSDWQRRRGDEFSAHFEDASTYLKNSVRELVAEEATWTVDEHGLLLIAGDQALVIINFTGTRDAVTLNGELHPIRLGLMEASFEDTLGERVARDVAEPFTPIVRRWTFQREDGFGREIAYRVTHSYPPSAQPSIGPELAHYRRREAVAHRLARALGWPLPTS